jgi:hypothetical protein
LIITGTEIEIVLEEFLDELKTPYIIADDLRALSWKHDLKLHSIKRRLIEMGAVESNKSNANGRNLVGIDGRVHHKVRKYELTAKYRNKKNERTSIIK